MEKWIESIDILLVEVVDGLDGVPNVNPVPALLGVLEEGPNENPNNNNNNNKKKQKSLENGLLQRTRLLKEL